MRLGYKQALGIVLSVRHSGVDWTGAKLAPFAWQTSLETEQPLGARRKHLAAETMEVILKMLIESYEGHFS